jgi:hypothetical protein
VSDEDTQTSTESHRPELDKDGFDCPRCGLWAHQHWATKNIQETMDYTAVDGSPRKTSMWKESLCARCGDPSLWRGDQMVYPLARLGSSAHEDMPDPVRELYEEAATVAAVSRRAGAALARATVERLLRHLDTDAPKKATLESRIDRIRNQVGTPLGQRLDIVRVLGNGMLHVDGDPGDLVVMALDDDEGPALIELLLDTANDLVDELIARPQHTKSLWAKLPDGIREKLLKRQRETTEQQ